MSIAKLYTWNPTQSLLATEVTAEINQLITEVNTMYKTDGSTGSLIVGSDLTITGEFKGDRLILPFGNALLQTTDVWFFMGGSAGSSPTYDIGYTMNRPGSVTGYSFYSVGVQGPPSSLIAQLLLQKNSSTIISGTSHTYTALGDSQTDRNTITRGTTTFVAGDKLTMKWDYTSGTGGVSFTGYVEVQFNT